MDGAVVELEIPARAEFVALARLVVSSFASTSFGLEDDRIDDLKIAVSEACTNAIEAHDAAETDERVLIRCDDNEGHLEVRIEDRGRGFDPETLPEHPPVTDPTRLKFERGLGIPLIRSLVDDLDITSSDAGTQVRIVMRREDDEELLEED
ncbi:MAG TPA: ATP-binding protein [Acidimicrobiales bacterium]|nr:ATP-binding protein [Acidimicrobiales bacterium]